MQGHSGSNQAPDSYFDSTGAGALALMEFFGCRCRTAVVGIVLRQR